MSHVRWEGTILVDIECQRWSMRMRFDGVDWCPDTTHLAEFRDYKRHPEGSLEFIFYRKIQKYVILSYHVRKIHKKGICYPIISRERIHKKEICYPIILHIKPNIAWNIEKWYILRCSTTWRRSTLQSFSDASFWAHHVCPHNDIISFITQ